MKNQKERNEQKYDILIAKLKSKRAEAHEFISILTKETQYMNRDKVKLIREILSPYEMFIDLVDEVIGDRQKLPF